MQQAGHGLMIAGVSALATGRPPSDRKAILAELRRRRQDEPEPLRWCGANLIWAMRYFGDRREERTGRPSRLAELGNRLRGMGRGHALCERATGFAGFAGSVGRYQDAGRKRPLEN